MNESVFRTKSLDRISSPEQFDEYVKVSNPGVWMLITAFLVLIAGTFLWGIFGHLDTKVNAAVVSKDGSVVCYVDESKISMVTADMKVNVDNASLDISGIDSSSKRIALEESPEIVHALGSDGSDVWVHEVVLSGSLEEGVYQGTIVVDSVSPMSFVTN